MIDSSEFWKALEKLVAGSEIVIDRPRGSAHPKYPGFIYPIDYGYLKGTSSMDGNEIDVWKGSKLSEEIDGIICTVDLCKQDSEMKVLIGCTEEEKAVILKCHNKNEAMKGLLINRRA